MHLLDSKRMPDILASVISMLPAQAHPPLYSYGKWAQRGEVACPRSHSKSRTKPGRKRHKVGTGGRNMGEQDYEVGKPKPLPFLEKASSQTPFCYRSVL